MLCKFKYIARAAVIILLALSGCAALLTGKSATYERVVAQFEATVTSAEFVHHGPSTIVRKWIGPVRYAVINADPFQATIVRYNMNILAELTGLQVDQVGRSSNPISTSCSARAANCANPLPPP